MRLQVAPRPHPMSAPGRVPGAPRRVSLESSISQKSQRVKLGEAYRCRVPLQDTCCIPMLLPGPVVEYLVPGKDVGTNLIPEGGLGTLAQRREVSFSI